MKKEELLSSQGFDQWSEHYDEDVRKDDDDNCYPFAGYREIQEELIKRSLASPGKRVLDLGIGTGSLAKKLSALGFLITGVDFSREMLANVKRELPESRLIQADLTNGIPEELKKEQFDLVFCNYAIHHLSPKEQLSLVEEVMEIMDSRGKLFIADVMTKTIKEMEELAVLEKESWDPSEYYPVVEFFEESFPLASLSWDKFSYCSGILEIAKR